MKKIFLIGDSLMADYNKKCRPQYGYGEIIREYANDDVKVINLAHPGCSTKSFLDQNRFKMVEDSIEKGDLLIVEFGNNDEKIKDPLRYTEKNSTFLINLEKFCSTALSKGAYCVFANSPTRRNFIDGKIVDNHLGYPQSMKDFCDKSNYLCIDLNFETIALYNQLGIENTKKLHLIYGPNEVERYKDGVEDNSHYTLYGASVIAKLFLKKLEESFLPYNDFFIKA